MSNPGDRSVDAVVNWYRRNQHANVRTGALSPIAAGHGVTPHVYPTMASYRLATILPPPCLDNGPPQGFRGLGYLGVTLARRTPQTGWQRLAWAWLRGTVVRLWLRRCWTWQVEGMLMDHGGPYLQASRTLKSIPWRKMVKPVWLGLTLIAFAVADVLLNVTYWRNR